MRSDRKLKQLYKLYNKQYFRNKLPNIQVAFGTPSDFKKGGLGKTTCAVTIYNAAGIPKAVVIKKYKGKEWPYIKADLLHEICHVALPWGTHHGPAFHREMKRLFLAGAFNGVL